LVPDPALSRRPRRASRRSPGVLFREYPGKWQVWRRDPNTMEVSKLVHEQDDRPTLREVALEYFV